MADLQIHANLAIAAAAVFIPVCTATVGLRIYARNLKKVFVIGMGVAIMAEVGLKQLGYPAPAPSTQIGKPDSNIAFWPGELLQIPALGLVKLSLILFYRRVFTRNAAPRFNIVTWFMILIILLWTLSFFFSILFICGLDFAAYWTSTVVEKAHCVDTDRLHNAFAISDVVTDFVIICLPVPMIFGLHLTVARKIGILAIFSLGALTIAASIVRMIVFIQATAVNYDPHADFEFICTSGLYWSMIESGLGIIAACLPAQYGLLNTKGVQSLVASVQSAISLRSIRSSSQHPSLENANGNSERIGNGERNMFGQYAGMQYMQRETKMEPWSMGHGYGHGHRGVNGSRSANGSETQHITAHAEGPARYEREGELEEGMGDGDFKGKGGIVVTNSFESREGLA
ncbi:233e18dd-bbc7-4aaf-9392-5be7a1c50f53 [Sclerotinia trifoliorum]|uniref:233e18dd-bbc7-4aaf-9392-5be7a1c50f53 n=1 Tax=Sclerotinia trifoliorum TaxID=28548 RepID=A0A8H2W0P4_9HELO|nr:233e18dd-bbc7-4aaf-9392-5be7a1c50f53 [Sclerotinia trifoliorum]